MLKHEEMGAVDGCQRRFLNLDLFRQPFRFLLPDQQDRYRTFLGALLSLITLMGLVAFSVVRLTALTTNSDYKIQVQNKKYFYEDSDVFSFETHGFNVAAAITGYDGNPLDITDPEVGQIKFYMKRFGDVDFDFFELD